jgi:hypothetical protein
MKPKLTPWFPAHIKPVRVGDYECTGSSFKWHWNGAIWCNNGYDKWPCLNQKRVWRGLAEDPAKAAP